MNIPIFLILIPASAYFFTKTGKRIGVPSVVVLILLGIIVGTPFFSDIIIKDYAGFIDLLGEAGLVALMFVAGLESSWRLLYKEKKDALLIAMFAAFIPFSLGLTAFLFSGYSLTISLIIGICMAITAEATKAKVLLDTDKLKTKVGSAMMGDEFEGSGRTGSGPDCL